MRFKTYMNEAVFSASKLEHVADLLSKSIGNRIGQKFWRLGGANHIETFKRTGGNSGSGISYLLDSGVMVRFNLENNSDSSELSSVDVWKNMQTVEKPTLTIEVPSDFNSVEAVTKIAEVLSQFKSSLKEAFLSEGPLRKSKYDDRENLSKQYGIPDHLEDTEFKQAVVHAKKYLQLTGKMEISTLTQDIQKAQQVVKEAKITPEDLFQDLNDLVDLVANGKQPSLLVSGGAGSGKSFLITQKLEEDLGPEGENWVLIKGKTSTLGMYGALFVNRNKVVVFDDCDSVFANDDSINILKAALDSSAKRVVSWISKATISTAKMDANQIEELFSNIDSAMAEGLPDVKFPDKFEFKGKVIFISNIPAAKLDDAIKSRSFVIDINLDKDEMLQRMSQILPFLCKGSSMEDKKEVLQFMMQAEALNGKVNMRTFVNAVRIKESGNPRWQTMISRYA